MLVFNCTKAAADFFTTSRTKNGKREKISPIEAAPHKTIAESIDEPILPDDIMQEGKKVSQWHWLVHAVKVKRKNVLIVMDYHSRFAITLTGIKKGAQYDFLNMFDHHLNVHINEIMLLETDNSPTIDASLEHYCKQHNSCAFHQRGDRSVQSHINDVVWHFERSVDEIGDVPTDVDLIGFDAYVNHILRKRKGEKDYFNPQHAFLHHWLMQYADLSESQADQHINVLKEQERAEYQVRHHMMSALADDVLSQPIPEHVAIPNDTNKQDRDLSNVVCLDTFRKNK